MPLPLARSIDLVRGQGVIWWAPCCHHTVPRPSLWLGSHQPCCVADEETAAASLECGTWLAHEVISGGGGSVWPRPGPHMWVVWGQALCGWTKETTFLLSHWNTLSLCWILFGPYPQLLQVAACPSSLDFKLAPTKKLRFLPHVFASLERQKEGTAN